MGWGRRSRHSGGDTVEDCLRGCGKVISISSDIGLEQVLHGIKIMFCYCSSVPKIVRHLSPIIS